MVNHLNGSFNAQQARAIEKYVADFVAIVLKNAGEGSIEPGKYEMPKEPVKAPKASKVEKEADTYAPKEQLKAAKE